MYVLAKKTSVKALSLCLSLRRFCKASMSTLGLFDDCGTWHGARGMKERNDTSISRLNLGFSKIWCAPYSVEDKSH